jgi:hypothetical protein
VDKLTYFWFLSTALYKFFQAALNDGMTPLPDKVLHVKKYGKKRKCVKFNDFGCLTNLYAQNEEKIDVHQIQKEAPETPSKTHTGCVTHIGVQGMGCQSVTR